MEKHVVWKNIGFLVGLVSLLSSVGCGKMDDTYRDFVKDGRIIYAGKPDSLMVLPGRNRLVLTWVQQADPKVTDAVVYWNNRIDSLKVDIPKASGARRVNVPFEEMAEGTYQFEIYTYDSQRNRSVKAEVSGSVYGDQYEQTLLARLVENISWVDIERREVELMWGGIPDTTYVGSEIHYRNSQDEPVRLVIPASEEKSVLSDVGAGVIEYRSLYLPSSVAIDTFVTSFLGVKTPPGNPVELAKDGWSASASSEDTNGRRLAANAIDNNPATLWVNQIGAYTYPHTLTIDMGREETEVFGVTLTQRYPFVNPLRNFEVEISNDQAEWVAVGQFQMSNTVADPQYFDFAAPQNFRYFRIICVDDYGNSPNISLAEAGVYRR